MFRGANSAGAAGASAGTGSSGQRTRRLDHISCENSSLRHSFSRGAPPVARRRCRRAIDSARAGRRRCLPACGAGRRPGAVCVAARRRPRRPSGAWRNMAVASGARASWRSTGKICQDLEAHALRGQVAGVGGRGGGVHRTASVRLPQHGRQCGAGRPRGRVTVKSTRPSWQATAMSPSWSRTTWLAIYRPNPSPVRLRVTQRFRLGGPAGRRRAPGRSAGLRHVQHLRRVSLA